MKAHIHLLVLAIVVSIACHSQEDTLSDLPVNSDTVKKPQETDGIGMQDRNKQI